MEIASDPVPIRSASTTNSAGAKSGSGARRDTFSAVTNGSRLFVVPPGDTAWSRRFRDILNLIIADVSSSCPDGLSEGQRQLARRAATIAIVCERMEGEAAAGADINLDQYGRLTDRLGRTFHRLGLRRQTRAAGPTLSDYLRPLP